LQPHPGPRPAGIDQIDERFALLDLASPRSCRIIFNVEIPLIQETFGMKCLIVYFVEGEWIGEEVSWKRSGSGTYREVSRIEIPQSKAGIEKFAIENRFVIEWRGAIPTETAQAG
jgi:hypothetical protein